MSLKKIGILSTNIILIVGCALFPVSAHTHPKVYEEAMLVSKINEIRACYQFIEPERMLSELNNVVLLLEKTDKRKNYHTYCSEFLNILRLVKDRVVSTDEGNREYQRLYSKIKSELLSYPMISSGVSESLKLGASCYLDIPKTPKLKPMPFPIHIAVWDIQTEIP